MAIIGVGIDLVDVNRFRRALTNSHRLVERLFSEAEQHPRAESLAARFAAKEAVVKALGGVPVGFTWRDIIVHREPAGTPRLELVGAAAELAAALGITSWHISLSHDAETAIAMVVAENSCT